VDAVGCYGAESVVRRHRGEHSLGSTPQPWRPTRERGREGERGSIVCRTAEGEGEGEGEGEVEGGSTLLGEEKFTRDARRGVVKTAF
jgi:hypothetical protein